MWCRCCAAEEGDAEDNEDGAEAGEGRKRRKKVCAQHCMCCAAGQCRRGVYEMFGVCSWRRLDERLRRTSTKLTWERMSSLTRRSTHCSGR